MPYVSPTARLAVRPHAARGATSAGELNCQFTYLIVEYLRCEGLTYQSINDVVGALSGAMAEFQRRVVAPYEDDCIELHLDMYPEGFTQGRPNANL